MLYILRWYFTDHLGSTGHLATAIVCIGLKKL